MPASIEEALKKQKEDSEAKWDLIYIMAAVFGTVLFMTSLMVRSKLRITANSTNLFQLGIAWLAGARFDIAFSQFKSEFGKLMSLAGLDNGTAQVTEVHETLIKSEL